MNSHTCDDELAYISTWAKSNNLALNLGKSKEIIFQTTASRRRTVQQPNLHQSIARVSSITALGVVIDDKLSFSEHVDLTLKSCASGLYALKVLRAHGMPASSLHDVFNATVLAKILYCSPAWSGYCSAADRNRLDAFLRKAYKLGFYADISNAITNRFDAADDAFFGRIINNSSHVMRPLLHERLSNQYNLRSRHHDFILINKTNLLTDNSFIIRMLSASRRQLQWVLGSDAGSSCIMFLS